jgi:UDP-3-O-[3-hydroxymyristoyl] glucosamine N-acyltransferase
MWVSQKNINKLSDIEAGVIICPEVNSSLINSNCTYLICENPRLSFQKVLTEFFIPPKETGISSAANIDDSVKLGQNIFIGFNVVIEKNCVIGSGCQIGHNTVIKSGIIIGENVLIGSNNVIGGIGFGYEKDETGEYVLIPHIGNVVIHDNVEIGNNTCIDRAVMGSTVLFENVKIDNLVHIAHGVKVGKNSLIIANAMVAGSVEIGENVWVAPTSSILNGLKIGDNAVIGLGAVVVKKVENNQIIVGNPGRPLEKK